MNALSLAYSSTQTQQEESSWIDDPFELGGTGVSTLSHQRRLTDYAEELVGSYAELIGDQYELSFEKISAPFQFELARLYIESIDRDIEWACYGEDQSLNSDFLCALLAMLKDSTPRTRSNFAQVTSRNIVIYYKDVLQGILDDACHDYHCNEMNETGYHHRYDLDNGDLVWRKA